MSGVNDSFEKENVKMATFFGENGDDVLILLKNL